jgi:exonuclease V gamma subunit
VDGIDVEGSVAADPKAALVIDVTPSRGKANRRLALYAQVVFLSALDPVRPWRGILVGKGNGKDEVLVVEIGPLGDDPAERSNQAMARMAHLVSLHEHGMREPLPIFTETSYAWQSTQPEARFKKAASKWDGISYFSIPGDGDDPATKILFPDFDSFSVVAASAFPDHAERLWVPILDVSRESTR